MIQNLKDLSVSQSQISGETVEIRFIPLNKLMKLDNILWSKNAKKHDIDGLWESIDKYGFVDIAHFDSNLNDGNGGIVFGNGRTEVLVSALIEAKKTGKKAPKGIPVETESGEWCVPITFGCDQESEAMAIALGIDHNNLTVSGSGFSDFDIAKMWDMEGYVGLLSLIADLDIMPITVDAKAIGNLLLGLDDSNPEKDDDRSDVETEIDVDGIELDHQCPKCGFQFDAKK